MKSTVSWSISRSISIASGVRRHSVYRMAAAPSLPRLPKLPWPSTSGYRMAHGCAMRTRVS
ncbi:Uncharacterised protein [Mycobacteroides abscessus subsp. abscessus]|nr:Uncharacterised protein [Mycobacteroides abscessus subsp. abscessus]